MRKRGTAVFDIILFDLDGTLTDPEEGITKCVSYALEKMGLGTWERSRLRCFIGPPLKEQFMEFCGISEDRAEQAVEKYRERYRDTGIFENRAYPGIVPLLEKLVGRGMRLVIATSKPEVFARRILEAYGMEPYFREIVGSELDGRRTDKAQVIEEALGRMGVSREDRGRVLMVGDRKHDIAGAKRCGIASLGVRFGYAGEGELEEAGADWIVDTVEELEGFLLRGNAPK